MSSKPIILAIIISCCIWSIGQAHLNLYMSEKETRALLGIDGELFYVRNGIINKYALGFNVLIPSHMPSINFTWQSLKQSPSAMYYKMAFKVSNPKAMAPPVPSPLDKDGIVPNTPSNFHISLPCTGKVSAVVSVEIQLNISIFSASNLTSLNIKRRKVCVKDGESAYDFAAENANPVENVATTSTNIFYIAVGCACALILVIALIVAIYYICTSRRRPPRDRKRYEEYQPSQYDTASSQALSANTHNQPPLHNGSQQYMSQNGSLASIPGGRRPGYASSNSDYNKPPPQDPRVTLSDITINRKCVTLGDCLLTGTFGKVYHAKVISESEEDGITQQDVYVKTVTEEARSDQVEVLLRECATMKGFNNPNINPIMAVCIDGSEEGMSPLLIYMYSNEGNMKPFLQRCRVSDIGTSHLLNTQQLVFMSIQVIKGIQYLHRKRIVHKDLATRNCVVSSNLTVKLCDTALSRDLFPNDYHCLGDNENRPVKWLAIEALLYRKFSPASDVWSFGVVLWELMTLGMQPYVDIDPFEMSAYLQEGYRISQPPNCPDELFAVMACCWALAPEERPKFSQLLICLQDFYTALGRFI